MRTVLFLVVLAVLGAPALAEDVVVLKDGHRVTGTILSQNDEEVRIKVGDGEFILPRSLIAEIKRGEATGETPPVPEKPAPERPAEGGPDLIRLRDGGREIRGKILNEDETTITMQVGDQKLAFDKDVIEWVQQDGKTRRFGPKPATGPEAAPARRETSPAVTRWINVCMRHLVSDDPMVRRSAGLALRGLGAAARPALEKAAGSEDEALAAAARQILEGGRGGREGRNPEGGGRAGRGGNMNQRIAERLQITEEQRPKYDAIMEEATTKRRALMESMRSGEVDREAAMEQMREIQEATTASLAEVLDEDQMTRYREMMERMRGFGGRRGGGR